MDEKRKTKNEKRKIHRSRGAKQYFSLFTVHCSLFTALLLLGACRTVEQVTDFKSETARRDTVHVYTERRDSVVYRDSVFLHVYQRGDTVYHLTERWNVRYNDRVRIDTVYRVADYKSTTAERATAVVEKKEPWLARKLPWLALLLMLSPPVLALYRFYRS